MKQRHWLRWLAIGFGCLALALGVGLFIAVRHFDRDRVTALVADEVLRATGRSIQFDGAIEFHVLPALSLRMEDVRLSSTDWSTDPELLKVGRIDLLVALRPLLSGQLRVSHVRLDQVECLLETTADGQANWRLKPAAPKSPDTPADPSSGLPLTVAIDEVKFSNSRLVYRSGRSGRVSVLEIAEATIRHPGPGAELEGQASYRDRAFAAKGTLGRKGDVPGEPDALPWTLALDLDPSQATLKGVIDWPSKGRPFSFDVDADVRDAAVLERLAHLKWPGPLPMHVKGQVVRVDKGLMRSPHFELEAAGQSLQGEATLSLRNKRMHIGLQTRAESLDLAALLPPSGTAKPAEAHGGGSRRLFDDQPLPLTRPLPIDLDFALALDRATMKGKPLLSALQLQLVANDKGIEVPGLALQIGGGSVHAQADVALRDGDAPAWSLQAEADGVMLEALAQLSGADVRLQGGRTRLRSRLGGHGTTPHQLMNSLSGDLLIDTRKLRVAGSMGAFGGDLLKSLLDTLNPFQKREGGTQVNCAVARLPVSKGVIKLDNSLAVETDKLNVVAAGRIDLGDETMDLAFRPTIKEGLGLGAPSLASLVSLSGPLTEPEMGINASGLARGGLSIGAAAATGGLSLLAERMLKARTRPHPCQTALGQSASSKGDDAKSEKKGWLPKIFSKP